ncbi:helix-turn-helix transcriptional regulator [Nocardia fusca]|uniref:Helix-turn-helix transcriptional regulator n=1 Tax=Nocardia fusca TaxID=941183 RepID=A0ABV3F430_9NOCA
MTEVGRALRAARTAAGISLQGMAARTNYSKPYLGQLETGVRAVRAEHVAAYESALATPLGHLRDRLAAESVSTVPADDLPAQLTPLLLPPVPRAHGARDGFPGRELDAAEQLARWARARQWDDGAGPRRAVTAWLTTNLPRLHRLSPGRASARALLAGAELADIAAAMSWDVEDNGAARRYVTAAARLAHAAGDTLLTAAVLSGATWQCLDSGRPAEGLEVAQLAQYLARRTATPRLRATLAELEACAYGILGERAAFQRAIVVAAECRAEATSAGGGPTTADASLAAAATSVVLGPRRDWPGPGRQSELLGPSYRHLAATRPDLVRTAFTDVRAPVPDGFITPSMALISAARLQLMLGEPEQAAAQIGLATSLCGAQVAGRTAARLCDFRHESAEFAAVPAVREACTAITELIAQR